MKQKKIEESDYLLCTGLFDQNQELQFYKNLLSSYIDKEMVCTNPDLIVDRGNEREFCAGSIAKIFEELGGKVDYFGKPYSLVYTQAKEVKNKKILCVGDNLNTDIKGANIQNFNSLFISSGIHKNEAKNNLNNLLENFDTRNLKILEEGNFKI